METVKSAESDESRESMRDALPYACENDAERIIELRMSEFIGGSTMKILARVRWRASMTVSRTEGHDSALSVAPI